MSISTFGATNNSLNQGATYVGASPKSLRTVGGKTFTRYNTGAALMQAEGRLRNAYRMLKESEVACLDPHHLGQERSTKVRLIIHLAKFFLLGILS